MGEGFDAGAVRVISFDCYGTLIDWETGIWEAFLPALRAAGRDDVDRAAVLDAYAAEESRVEHEHPALPYDRVLARVHAALCHRFGLTGATPDLHERFAASIADWPPFADTVEALRRLKRHRRLVILSNVHEAGIAASLRRLGVEFDAVLTAEAIGRYKPDRACFEYLLEEIAARFGAGPDDLLHVAQSLWHDIAPATDMGLACAWIDRQGLRHGGAWGATPPADRDTADRAVAVFDTLRDLADWLPAP